MAELQLEQHQNRTGRVRERTAGIPAKLEDAYARQTMTEEELQSAYQMIDEARDELNSAKNELQEYCRNPDRYYWGITDEVFQLYHAGRSSDRFHQFFYRCAVQI